MLCAVGTKVKVIQTQFPKIQRIQFLHHYLLGYKHVVYCVNHCFSFRNIVLGTTSDGGKIKAPKPLKTGTTIAGVVYKVNIKCEQKFWVMHFSSQLNICVYLCVKDGVVLGADTRATSDEVVADKVCAKIHYIAPNI